MRTPNDTGGDDITPRFIEILICLIISPAIILALLFLAARWIINRILREVSK